MAKDQGLKLKDKRLLKLAASFFMKRIALVSIVVEVVAAMAALSPGSVGSHVSLLSFEVMAVD